MKRLFLSVVVLGAAIGTPMIASAASDNHATLPTENTKNCRGQAIAWLVQGNNTFYPGPGLGNVAEQINLTVKEIQDQADLFCDSLPDPA